MFLIYLLHKITLLPNKYKTSETYKHDYIIIFVQFSNSRNLHFDQRINFYENTFKAWELNISKVKNM